MKRTVIPIGPYHPLQEEPEFFKLYVEGERVVDIEMFLGYNHRGIEKLSEAKTFDQSTFLVERICGICSTSHPFAYTQAVEDMADLEVPERARYIRTIIGELERIHSHLLWVGLAGHFLGYNTVFMWVWKCREPVLDICEKVTGNRNHYAMFKPGGVRRDIPNEAKPEIIQMLDKVTTFMQMITKAVLDDPVLHARLKGVGALSKEDAIRYCVVGPTVRASGIPRDIRRDYPYAAYDRVDWNVVTAEGGDVFAKAVVRLLEIFESAKIIKECLKKMPDGPIDGDNKTIKAGEGIGQHEAPRGEVFHYVRGDGGNHPVRHKIRAPSYVNIPSFKATVVGETVSDAALILASVDPCYCCTERVTVVDRHSGKEQKLTEADLVRLSHEKTQKIKKELGEKKSPLERLNLPKPGR